MGADACYDGPMRISANGGGRAALFAILLLAAAAVAASALLPVQSTLTTLGMRLRGGPGGIALFGALYVAGAMAFVPASVLSLAAGLIFGATGIALAWLAMMVAAILSLWLGRALLAGPARRLIARQRLARAVADVIDEEGWRMVLLVRVSGIVPFGLQNYIFGATRIGAASYMAATAVGVLPSILVYGGVGAFGNVVATHAPTAALFAIAVAAGLALVIVAGRKVRARLRAA